MNICKYNENCPCVDNCDIKIEITTYKDVKKGIRRFTKGFEECEMKYIENKSKAIHYLETEIRISEERREQRSPMYDGENVGFTKMNRLLDNHIRFCKHILKLLN